MRPTAHGTRSCSVATARDTASITSGAWPRTWRSRTAVIAEQPRHGVSHAVPSRCTIAVRWQSNQ